MTIFRGGGNGQHIIPFLQKGHSRSLVDIFCPGTGPPALRRHRDAVRSSQAPKPDGCEIRFPMYGLSCLGQET